MNGTVEGEDVFIPLGQIIGGRSRAGFGWNMLMDCLAEGRGVSLPAMSTAASKLTSASVGAYARIRKQFKVIETSHVLITGGFTIEDMTGSTALFMFMPRLVN